MAPGEKITQVGPPIIEDKIVDVDLDVFHIWLPTLPREQGLWPATPGSGALPLGR